MNVIYTIAGVAVVIFGLLFLLSALGRAKKTTEGEVKTKDAAISVIGGFLLILGGIVLFLQILAAVGVGSQATDPYSFTWVNDLFKQMMTGGLPQLR